MKKVCAWALAVGLCSAFAGTVATAADWTLLGERILNYRSNEVYIAVKNDGAFKQIKLQVKGSPIEIASVKVAFKDGTSFDSTVESYIAPGDSTKVIDLPAAKSIEKVTFDFRKISGTAQLATVRLLATQ